MCCAGVFWNNDATIMAKNAVNAMDIWSNQWYTNLVVVGTIAVRVGIHKFYAE